jgi:hypothetical protein
MPPDLPPFPHLQLKSRGAFVPRFGGGPRLNADVVAARLDPQGHSSRLSGILDGMQTSDAAMRLEREAAHLPAIPAGRGFLLRLPEGADVDYLTGALGVELVAETEDGLILVSTEDLEYTDLYRVLREFGAGLGSTTAGSSLLDVYEQRDDPRKLDEILTPEVRSLWPLHQTAIYTFDLSIQTASGTRDMRWPSVRRRQTETAEEFIERRENARSQARFEAEDRWLEKAETRVEELHPFVRHFGGEFLTGVVSEDGVETESGMIFADSVQVRLRMSGEGLQDIVLNFPHLFEVSLPPDLQATFTGHPEPAEAEELEILPPDEDAPAVCVIDSGIQEEHRWLEPAMDIGTSHCFLPGHDPDEVADHVSPQGHGTRVAGAVLYPRYIPREGPIYPIAWIQNARVLDDQNSLPVNLPPELYLQKVVEHFHTAPRYTKIFNHSINARRPCPRKRMTAWAAKLDELSHEHDVLFVLSAGNQDRLGTGDQANTGLAAHLAAGRIPPEHQLEDCMRVASPAQSLHSLTVGSVTADVFDDGDRRSFADRPYRPSGFSRSGFGQPWSVVKPDVVEIGGDLVYSTPPPIVALHETTSVELLNSTLHGQPAYSRDGVGTSFAAPKVAHIAAHLQSLFPAASPLLYRALIAQSALWPSWTDQEVSKDSVLRWIGYGLPSLERAISNTPTRVTLITPDAEILPGKQFHLYTVKIPQEVRSAAIEARIRVDVTLAYTALPRRTRARRTGYLETWLDWEASRLGEPADAFLNRMQNGGAGAGQNIPWTLHTRTDLGEVEQTTRSRGSLQKDWAIIDSYELPEEFSIAVRSHLGWNHRDEAGSARYCLAVTFEVLDMELPLYALIEEENRIEIEQEGQIRIEA